jgi:type II secretory pathway pseudopilin PulG
MMRLVFCILILVSHCFGDQVSKTILREHIYKNNQFIPIDINELTKENAKNEKQNSKPSKAAVLFTNRERFGLIAGKITIYQADLSQENRVIPKNWMRAGLHQELQFCEMDDNYLCLPKNSDITLPKSYNFTLPLRERGIFISLPIFKELSIKFSEFPSDTLLKLGEFQTPVKNDFIYKSQSLNSFSLLLPKPESLVKNEEVQKINLNEAPSKLILNPTQVITLNQTDVEIKGTYELNVLNSKIHELKHYFPAHLDFISLEFLPSTPFVLEKNKFLFPKGLMGRSWFVFTAKIPFKAGEMTLPKLEIQNDFSHPARVLILAKDNIRLLDWKAHQTRISHADLTEFNTSSQNPVLANLLQQNGVEKITLKTEKLPTKKTLTHKLINPKAQTVISDNLTYITSLSFDILNIGLRKLVLPLDKENTLLSATCNEKPIKSFKEDATKIALIIPEIKQQKTYPIKPVKFEIKYQGTLKASSKNTLELPLETVEQVNWKLYYPSGKSIKVSDSNLNQISVDIDQILHTYKDHRFTRQLFKLVLAGLFLLLLFLSIPWNKLKIGKPNLFVQALISIAIIGFLAALAVPNFRQSRSKSNKRACFANQKTILGAIEMWSLDTGRDPQLIPMNQLLDLLVKEKYLQSYPNCPGSNASFYEHNREYGIYCRIHGNIDGTIKGDVSLQSHTLKAEPKKDRRRKQKRRPYPPASPKPALRKPIHRRKEMVNETVITYCEAPVPNSSNFGLFDKGRGYGGGAKAVKKKAYKKIKKSGIKPVKIQLPKPEKQLEFSTSFPLNNNPRISCQIFDTKSRSFIKPIIYSILFSILFCLLLIKHWYLAAAVFAMVGFYGFGIQDFNHIFIICTLMFCVLLKLNLFPAFFRKENSL